MNRKTGAAGVHRFLTLPRAPQFFGELRKRNRRRILLDPASEIFNPLVVCHTYWTRSVCEVEFVRPLVWVTVSVIVYVPFVA